MTTKERFDRAKALAKKTGKSVTTGDTKTTTTTAPSGWSITRGTQKKTLPGRQPKAPSIPSTAGKTKTYAGGRSTVVDLGHNPTKDAISKATTQLRKAKKATTPKPKPHTASSVPKVTVPQEGAPTTTPQRNKSVSTTGTSTTNIFGPLAAVGTAIGTVAGTALLLKKQKPAEIELAKPVGEIEPLKQSKMSVNELRFPKEVKYEPPAEQLKLPAPPKGLPKPPLGLPGPEKVEVKVPKGPEPTPLKAVAAPKPTPVRGRAGTMVKPPTVAKVTVPTPAAIEARTPVATEAARRPVTATGTGYYTVEELNKREGERRQEQRRNTATRMTKAEAASGDLERGIAPKGGSRRKQGSNRRATEAASRPVQATGVGYYTNEQLQRIAEQRQETKPVRRAGVPKVTTPNVGMLPEANKAPETPAAPKPPAPKTPASTPADVTPPRPAGASTEAPKVGRLDGIPEATAPSTTPAAPTERRVRVFPRRGQERAGTGRRAGETPARAPAPVVPAQAPAPAGKTTADLLAEARAENATPKEQAGIPKVEAPTSAAPIPDTTPETTRAAAGDLKGVDAPPAPEVTLTPTEQRVAQKARERRAGRKAGRQRKQQSIEEKGIATIPTDPAEGAVEEAVALQKKAERNLLDVTAKVSEEGARAAARNAGKKYEGPGPTQAVHGAESDRRTSEQMFGKEAVEAKVRKIPMVPPDLETDHGTKEFRGSPEDLIKLDQTVRGQRAENIRTAANKARNIAASRNATPEQMDRLEQAIDKEYDRTMDEYFDEYYDEMRREPSRQQTGKADARTMFLDRTMDAETELARARGSALPAAPSDKKTIDERIAEIRKRMAPGGAGIYRGEEALKQLEAIKAGQQPELPAPRSTRALPPVAEVINTPAPATEVTIPNVERRARVRGPEGRRDVPKQPERRASPTGTPSAEEMMQTRATEPRRQAPDVLRTGSQTYNRAPAPTEPARYRESKAEVPKSYAEIWENRIADWGRKAYEASIKKLTSPAIEVAGEKAKSTFSTEARIKAAKGLGLAALGFSALEATQAGAEEPVPEKRLGTAAKTLVTSFPATVEGIAKFTVADYGITKVIPAVAQKVVTSLGANAARAAFARGATAALGRLGIAGYIGKYAIPMAVRNAKELATQIGEGYYATGEAKREAKTAQEKYGTVEAATRTRKAKEAYKRRQALEAKKRKA